MAIAFARSQYASRSDGANACCKSAYNSRSKIKCESTGITYNFSKKDDSAYSEILLPSHVDKKFLSPAALSNEVERTETKKNSQLYVEWVLALPKEEEVSFDLKVEMVHEFIKRKGWVEEGLGVQIDIHAPHEGEVNWHAHLLVTTRRFKECGKELGSKARDLQPQVRFGKVQKTVEIDNNIFWRDVQNDLFKAHDLNIRVDLNGEKTQEHIGPLRMRSLLNTAVDRNEEVQIANRAALIDSDSVLNRITSQASVFQKEGIKRLVDTVGDKTKAAELLKEVLSNDRLEILYDDNAIATSYYTTKEVRAEELKLLRLAEYASGQKNILKSAIGNSNWKSDIRSNSKSTKNLTDEQEKALSHLVLSDAGIRILRGRAGTGKSHVLGKLVNITSKYKVNVVGLAPTHKAKDELIKVGFTQVDTVKGMLFKLYNGRFHLPKHSLIVVDEAGMIGNDDYTELLRVAAARECNVIKSGDERQITPIQRGGMFETFAERFGSATMLDIKRQEAEWGREVASNFSRGEVLSGITVLKEHNKIIENADKVESMEQLLKDWSASSYSPENKIILAVKNKDVDALNIGARQYLKANGTLTGDEISVGDRYFMQGDSIIIKETNKHLGLVNGDYAKVLKASKNEFTIEVSSHDQSKQKKVSFNPSSFSGFRHAYAVTIFKVQAASILDVFVFHDGFAGLRNSYVALSRHIKDLKLYINAQATKSLDHLVKQMSIDHEKGCSLELNTRSELEAKYTKTDIDQKGLFAQLVQTGTHFFGKKITELKDKYIPDWDYYNYEAIPLNSVHVEKVLDSAYIEEEANIGEEIVANLTDGNLAIEAKGGSGISGVHNGPKMTPKQKFYAKADKRGSVSDTVSRRAEWDRQNDQLKHEAKFRAGEIATLLLGAPNAKLSNSKTLRFGESGKIAVRISGDRAGQWYDFSGDKGGDIFSLVSEAIGGDFKASAEYLRSALGIDKSSNLHLVERDRGIHQTEKHIKANEAAAKAAKAKLVQVEKLIEKAKVIHTSSVASRYLRIKRGITCELSPDLRTTGVYNKEIGREKGEYLPTLIAFAKDKNGEITGGQQIFLNKTTAGKANVELTKKSFGKIAGSFAHLSELSNFKLQAQDTVQDTIILKENEGRSALTIIAEGLETALSVKQALGNDPNLTGIDIKVLCSLGVSNIRNYIPALGEQIIIAADNDGESSNTFKVVQNAKDDLMKKGALVSIVMPETKGDFNDLLREANGESKIKEVFASTITKLNAKNLDELFKASGEDKEVSEILSKQELSDLNYIREYSLSEKALTQAYSVSSWSGKLMLEEMRKHIDFAKYQVDTHQDLVAEAITFDPKIDTKAITRSIIGMDETKAQQSISNTRDNSVRTLLDKEFEKFDLERARVKTISAAKELIVKEQSFLQSVASKLKSPLSDYGDKVSSDLVTALRTEQHKELIEKTFALADNVQNGKIMAESSILSTLLSSPDIETVHDKLERALEMYKAYTAPAALIAARLNAKTTAEALELINKEQSLILDINSNTKHIELDKDLAVKCSAAKLNEDCGIPKQLQDVVQDLLETKAMDENEILAELKATKDIAHTYKALDTKLESNEIANNIKNLAKEKQAAKTIDDTVTAIKSEEEFFSSLDNRIKYKDSLNSSEIASIKYAKQNKQDNVALELNKLSKFIQESKGFTDHAPAIKALKSAINTKDAHDKLLNVYHQYFLEKVQTGIEHIESGKTLNFDKQKWTCPIEFIDHVLKTSNKTFAPHKELKIMRANVLTRTKDLEIGGPTL